MSPLLPTILLATAALVAAGPFILKSFRELQPLQGFSGTALLWRAAVLVFVLVWFIPYYQETGLDAVAYYYKGIAIDESIAAGHLDEIEWKPGTAAMNVLTAVLFYPFGATLAGSFIVGSIVGLAAALLFIKAACVSRYRRDDLRMYCIVLLLLPSYAMWTGIAGKDSWVSLGIGLISYGYARALRRTGGIALILAGMIVTTTIRPHIALALFASMALAALIENAVSHANRSHAILLLLVSAGGLWFAVLGSTRLFGVERMDTDRVFAVAETVSEGNRLGGSVVDDAPGGGDATPFGNLPNAFVRVLFRPFLWEANNVNAVLAGVENLFIVWMLLRRVGRLGQMAVAAVKDRYLLFCALSCLQITVMLSPISNLGLLSRERVQLFPFFFCILFMARTPALLPFIGGTSHVVKPRHPSPAIGEPLLPAPRK